ncbi:MAG: hypothetical protein KBS41_01230 [Oscillospiraceae bacterium]|nr:hypothetical protein [Candidatus Equicaccousia limihippi]
MLRGASKTIIEIAEPESKYFEKVILFIKPEFGSVPHYTLKNEAKNVIDGYSKAQFKRKKRKRDNRPATAKLCGAAFCILLAMAGLVYLGIKIF